MKFGLFYEWPNPTLRDWKRLFEEGVEQIQFAEEMGYDFVFIAEHHFSNYGMSPSPLLEALHIAHRTRRIKIVTACLVLPIWPALRLAEETAVVDNITGGRLVVGVGRGYQPHEFLRHGVTVEESRRRFSETLDVLRLAWQRVESFTYDGEFVKVPHPVTVWPKPYQKPHPPIWLIGTSEESMRLAAREDFVPIASSFIGPEGMEAAASIWVQTRLSLGKPIDGLELGMQSQNLVAESDDEARKLLPYSRWQNRAGRALNRLEVFDGAVRVTPYEGEPDEDGLWERVYYGSPQTVAAKFRRAADAGVTFVSNWMMLGDVKHETVMRSIRLMGEEVLPELHEYRAGPELLERLSRQPEAVGVMGRQGPAPSD